MEWADPGDVRCMVEGQRAEKPDSITFCNIHIKINQFMRKRNLLLLLLLTIHCGTKAQSQTGGFTVADFTPQMPPSPTAAEMIRYLDIPVGLATGTPNVSIPIYEVTSGQLKLPISLNYHASGIKVTEDAGAEGLGWSISDGGLITRVPMGNSIDDGSWLDNGGPNWLPQALNTNDSAQYTLLRNISRKTVDGCPDLFNYTFPGGSGKFIIADSIRLLDQQDVAISRQLLGLDNYIWQVTVQDGTKYIYVDKEVSNQKGSTSISNASASWYLSKIVSANGMDSMVFTYVNTLYDFTVGSSAAITIWNNGAEPGAKCQATFTGSMTGSGNGVFTNFTGTVNGKQLTRIDFNNGSVEFKIDWNQRADHAPNNSYNVPKLNEVIVRNKNGQIVKAAHFLYDYYNNQSTDLLDKRLKLISVVFNGDTTTPYTPDKLQYSFDYNQIPLPNRYSLAQDHWGYYNGADYNTTLIPSWYQHDPSEWAPPACPPIDRGYVYLGANRNSSDSSVAGTLEKITYPTGGYTSFEYEPNTVAPAGPSYVVYPFDTFNLNFAYTGAYPDFKRSTNVFSIPVSNLYPNGICARITGHCPYINPGDHGAAGFLLINETANDTVYIGGFAESLLDIDEMVTLQPGNYRLVIRSTLANRSINAGFYLILPQTVAATDRIVGGIRIKKITHFDPVTGTSQIKTYKYTDSTGFSSGRLFREPVYELPVSKYFLCPPNPIGPVSDAPCNYDETKGISLSSNSVYSIGAGNHITYGIVTEVNADQSYSTSKFTTFTTMPTAGGLDASWRRGLLLNKKDFVSDNTLVHETINTYTIETSGLRSYVGYTVADMGSHPCAALVGPENVYQALFNQQLMVFSSEWMHIAETVDKMYYPNGIVVNDKKYFFDNPLHKQVTREVMADLSDHSDLTTYYHYAKDYNVGTPTNDAAMAIVALQNTHADNMVIEKYSQKTLSGVNTVTGGEYIEYTRNANNLPVYKTSYRLAIDGPVINYDPVSIVSGFPQKDNRYTFVSLVAKRDEHDNAIEMHQRKGTSAFIFAYNKEYPIAAVENAGADEIAYTSFEDSNQKGNWNYSPNAVDGLDHITGLNEYNLAGNDIVVTGFWSPPHNIGTPYIISYWKKGGNVTIGGLQPSVVGDTVNGWIYCQHLVTTSTSVVISGNTKIDELRLYPVHSLMRTYVYNPLIGLIDGCDEKSMISRYSYDQQGRLILLKDAKGNIVKKTEYAIQQPE